MRCNNCGTEITEKTNICPQCDAKISTGMPSWLIILIIVVCVGFFTLPILGIVAAMTIPTLISNTDSVKNRTCYKKTLATLNQALLMSEAINSKTYSRFDDVWNIAIKGNLANPQDIPNGLIMADGTEVKYERLGNPCVRLPKEPSAHTACAILTIDTNGQKGPNKRTVKGSTSQTNDQFKVLLYSTGVAPETGTPEDDIIMSSRSNY